MTKLFLCLLIATPVLAQHEMHEMKNIHHEEHTSKNIFVAQMDTMMMNMDTVRQTKKTNVDFLQLMIPHHQGAVEMAKYEVTYGKNIEMIQLAKSIIAEQQIEIQMMKKLLSSQHSIEVNNDLSADWAATMNTMMKDMPQGNELKNVDMAFAKVMLPHHQAGIDMAKVLLQHGNDYAVKRMAESIISSQQIEIEQMKHYINK
jgi:uncharacterized protein (DUF305 family)